MEQDSEKLNDKWTAWLGDDAYIALTDSIGDVIDKIGDINSEGALLSAIEGGLLGICDTSLSKESFWDNVMQELNLTSASDREKTEIINILRDFVDSFGFKQSIYNPSDDAGEKEVTPSTDTNTTRKSEVLKQLESTLSTPTTFAPTKRDIDASAPSASQKEASKIDPYREIPEQ